MSGASGLGDLEQRWDDGARNDAMYVILSEPGMKGQRWDTETFFERGRIEVDAVVRYTERLGVPTRRFRALDFGCGIGRLTQALAEHFEQVDGVDVSSAMVEQARSHNRYGERCSYHHNPATDLRLFEDDRFDLIYSNIVLQHIAPDLARGYVAEFVRVLAPGGFVCFQLPSEPSVPATGQSRPLRRSAFAASLAVDPAQVVGAPGSQCELRITVANNSKRVWPAAGGPDDARRINVGNHWLGGDGSVLQFDDQRVPLPVDLAPGQATELAFPVTLPDQAGEYMLELDVVQESVAWFAERGSPVTRIPTRVEGSAVTTGEAFSIWEPTCLDVHGVPREEVLALLTSHGAEILDITDDASAGPGWISYRYAATKPA